MKSIVLFFSVFFGLCLSQQEGHARTFFKNDSTIKHSYYFISNRNTTADNFEMYKARTNQSGISSCVIKGNFEVDGFAHMRKAEIAVYNISNDELVGIYNTNAKTGNYLIVLVPNVKYEFVVNTYGYAPIKKIVEVPNYASTNVLDDLSSQKMKLKMEGDQVKLSLNTWIVEEKEPTLFLLTVYNENQEETHHVELYQALDEEFNEIAESSRKQLKETDFGDIDELLKSQAAAENKKPELAEKAFKAKEYKKAIEIYSQLLKLDPSDPVANYRKGVSLYHTEQNKLKALPYLKKGIDSPKTPYHVHYLIGKSHHLWSDFAKAQRAFEIYKTKATTKEIEALNINRLIENCVNGKKLMEEQLNMEIINKTAIDIEKLPKGYPLELVGEKLQRKTSFFISPIDAKKKEKLFMFKTEQNEMIQTSYGLDGKNKKDLFVNRLMGGDKWGIPKSLGENINTDYDEDYAYVTLDGRTMYFSSKGHNSIGGYDIFVSERASSTDPWGEPKNVGYPINSPHDDILFMPDLTGEIAYFSSNRRSPTGGFNLYKIKMPKPPLPLTVIKGHFMTTDSTPNFSASIAVYNTNNQEIVGIYNTNANTGNFLMALMPGIKYEFALECNELKEHIAYVTVPVQTEPYTLRQNIRLKREAAFEILKVDNFFTKEEAENAPEYTRTKKDFVQEKAEASKKILPSSDPRRRQPNTTQRQVLANAEQLFVNKQYLKAADQFSKVAPLVDLTHKQSFYYGKALFNISKDYEFTLKYLENAAIDENTPYEVYYMMGRTNHYAYRFERAIKAYERYNDYATEQEKEAKNVESAIQLCKAGKTLVNNPKPVEVLSRKKIKHGNILTLYNSLDLQSKFLSTPDDMVSAIDKKKKFNPIMYLNQSKTLIYYTSYDEDGANGKDIYVMRKLPNNTWSAPINLGETINTPGDENYPYLTSDGKTLYFASTAHGSMGGYDIFKSSWNEKKDKWNAPVNLGAPINSPFDDFFYIE